ncbi:hypothetical protein MCHI_000809, partial [Candidatus Magnetoovum chiemensis]
MKIIIEKDEFIKKLADIQSIVEKKSTMPILSHFLLNVCDNSYIFATDLEVAIKEPLIIQEIIEQGVYCIPASISAVANMFLNWKSRL